VWLPSGELAHFNATRAQHEMTDDDLAVGGVQYERLAPMQSWRLTADVERFALDLTFDALTPPVGVDGQGRSGSGASAATGATVGKGHLEQAGRWTGWIDVDGTRHELVDARGNRDKSWGPRRWGGPKMWRWFSINIGDDTHFGGIRIGTESGDLHRGWVWTDGAHSSIREWKVTTELAPDGVTHTATHVHATDKAGRVHELDAEILRVSPGPAGVKPNTTIVNEGLARWHYNGATGYGISEYLHQLDADARPVVPIE
jgi:predicted secreted hydrolase